MREAIIVAMIFVLVGMFSGSIIACSIYDVYMINAYCSTHCKLTSEYLQCKKQPLYTLVRKEINK
ncbi:MAG: hypothetical protein J6T10_26625 [Methanobrevibacter sp.]|nr:hypothetical protein [Methanobrevibacter sp.]